MTISKINLSDLKASNINQLATNEMLMILGGCDRGRNYRSNKCGRDSYSNKGGSGCVATITPTTCAGSGSSVPAPIVEDAV